MPGRRYTAEDYTALGVEPPTFYVHAQQHAGNTGDTGNASSAGSVGNTNGASMAGVDVSSGSSSRIDGDHGGNSLVPPDERIGAQSPSATWHKAYKVLYEVPLDYEASPTLVCPSLWRVAPYGVVDSTLEIFLPSFQTMAEPCTARTSS